MGNSFAFLRCGGVCSLQSCKQSLLIPPSSPQSGFFSLCYGKQSGDNIIMIFKSFFIDSLSIVCWWVDSELAPWLLCALCRIYFHTYSVLANRLSQKHSSTNHITLWVPNIVCGLKCDSSITCRSRALHSLCCLMPNNAEAGSLDRPTAMYS